MRFKVGDRVRTTPASSKFLNGAVGTITRIDTYYCTVGVEIEGEATLRFFVSEAHLEPHPTNFEQLIEEVLDGRQ